MSRKIVKDLNELLEAGILNEEIAEKIQAYYDSKKTDSGGRLTLIFSVLGATLVGLGIILILAHNWDNLSKPIKTFFAFLPMIIGQLACGYSLFKKKGNRSWAEGSAVFLFFAVGAAISLISQIYHIEGDLGSFLLTWSLLGLPLVYLMPSSMVSLLYIGGITWYAVERGYGYRSSMPYLYIPLILAVVPHYFGLWKTNQKRNFFNFHSWFLVASIAIVLGTISDDIPELMWIAYTSLFSLLFLLGKSKFLDSKGLFANPFRLLGALGLIIIFIISSFNLFWEEAFDHIFEKSGLLKSSEFWISILFTGLATYLFIQKREVQSLLKINPLSIAFFLYPVLFFIGINNSIIAAVLGNVIALTIGLYYINFGTDNDHLGYLNLGLLTITALIISRFFDMDISFVLRGLLFIGLGVMFFIANFRLVKRRNQEN
ncbi:DUF2157 domain-containing protein [Saprospiraceae bacterium]|jgi:uncharacterized membrane protein|nr:DUF2157 domain-containing protein [Bacteroidota bacterium]MDB4728123.1 DUF2157 domain-containing protein [Saprospiraceae bacterium]MDF1864035.1 DUF2157 domain-containing protein [Saprospiraceae bacterium]